MTRIAMLLAAALSTVTVWSTAPAVELDPKIVGFTLPKDIKWTENTRAGNRGVVLQGDPSKPGPYSRLACFALRSPG